MRKTVKMNVKEKMKKVMMRKKEMKKVKNQMRKKFKLKKNKKLLRMKRSSISKINLFSNQIKTLVQY